MDIQYTDLTQSDIPILTPIMKAAFDEDTRMHTALSEDGPWGYDTGELLFTLLQEKQAVSKVIWCEKKRIGEYTVLKDGKTYTLDMFFIDPKAASKGIGTAVFQDIEKAYPDAEQWNVETPAYSARNRHFYEKCGFKVIREKTYSDGAKSLIFEKKKLSVLEYREERDYEAILQTCRAEKWESFCTAAKEEYKTALKNSVTYTAFLGETFCGYIRCLTDGVFTTYCCEIVVSEKYRHRGIGKALIQKIKALYPSCCMDVLSDNDGFYQANDFLLLCSGMRRLAKK